MSQHDSRMDGTGENSGHGIEAPVDAPYTIADALYVTDSGGTLSLGTSGGQAHVFEDADGTALCGHPSTATHDRERVGQASHDHAVVGDHRVCGNCSAAVRSRIAAGDLSTADETLDLALRAEAGDELVVSADGQTQRMVVETVEWRHGRVCVEGVAAEDYSADAKHYHDRMGAKVQPGGAVEVLQAGCLLDGRRYEDGSVSRPVRADGGVDTVETADAVQGTAHDDVFEPIRIAWVGGARNRVESAVSERADAEGGDTAADPATALTPLTRRDSKLLITTPREAQALRYELQRLTPASLQWRDASSIRALSRARRVLDDRMRERGYEPQMSDESALIPGFEGYERG